jgi:hypothetical protein
LPKVTKSSIGTYDMGMDIFAKNENVPEYKILKVAFFTLAKFFFAKVSASASVFGVFRYFFHICKCQFVSSLIMSLKPRKVMNTVFWR